MPFSRLRLSLDSHWRFHLGDIAPPAIRGHEPTYANAKAGKSWGAAAPDFDDSAWRLLNLPHDWALEGPFDPNENASQGYRPRGIAWYRRQFRLDDSDRGSPLEIQFDGIATHCTVWFNGTLVHRNFCGYTSFHIDITPFALYGDAVNTLAVRVDATVMEGWWYEGAGIYRHVWLVKRPPVHIVTDGIFAQPLRMPDGTWQVPVEVTVFNAGRKASKADIIVQLADHHVEITEARAQTVIEPLRTATVHATLKVSNPRLWSVDAPELYGLTVSVGADGVFGDAEHTFIGFRTIRFSADHGFFLNDQPLKLQGVCCHHDHAGVGVAVPDALWEFRIRKLKSMGANAYRCSHNPPAKEFLDACDRLGLLVMDENRHFNPAPEYMRQLEWLVRRDRNHPSVIMWSVFNEEPMQGTEVGYEMVRRMVATVKALDATRPVTAAMNGGLFSPVNVSQAVDVVGFNYQTHMYDAFHAANPNLPVTSSEDTSAFMTRGNYRTDPERHLIASYDDDAAPWGATHRSAWKAIAMRPWLAGGFIWTGFDYRGEPTPHEWPSASSFFGCMDLCGFPKAAAFIHRAHWIKNHPVLHLLPHWTWPGKEGHPIKVMPITNAQRVTLHLNGQQVADLAIDPFDFASAEIPYAPGHLEAIAYTDGKEVARQTIETTGPAVALEIPPDTKPLRALRNDGRDARPLTIRALDAHNRPVPTADHLITLDIDNGKILGTGNGDPNSHHPETTNTRPLFNGLAQVIVQSLPLSTGKLTLRASAPALAPATIEIPLAQVHPFPAVPAVDRVLSLRPWRLSPWFPTRPDPLQQTAAQDMNSWSPLEPGTFQKFAHDRFALYRATFSPHAALRRHGGTLRFGDLRGKAELYLNEILIAAKSDFSTSDLSLTLPPNLPDSVTITVLIESRPADEGGLGGPVLVQARD